MQYWQGKRALVTGGSSGLGRALTAALVERGARVAIVARNQAALDQAAEEISAGGEVVPIAADVTVATDFERMAATVRERFCGLDLFCHCAGLSMRGEVMKTSPDDFRALWELNFLAAVRGAQAFAEELAQNRGHLVLVASLASKVAPRYLGAYPASKFPLVALAQQLRMELGPRGLHTLLVCPGPIARDGATSRYVQSSPGVPTAAQGPGGGANVAAITSQTLSTKILDVCERRKPELIVPAKARLLFAVSQFWPSLGDWLLRKNMSQ
jgi:short-subunit dehydrogenase